MSAARRQAHEGEGNSERWLLTYADMITLLLALFVVLFAFSTIDVKKFLELKLGLTAAFNPSAIATKGGSGLLQQTSLDSTAGSSASRSPVLEPSQGSPKALNVPDSQQIANEIELGLEKAGLGKYASVAVNSQGAVVHILADKVFFATGSASLGPVGNQIVDVIGSVVRPDPNGLMVEGFTDNVPINSGVYTSNWQLSAMRAANVVERLNTVDRVSASRLASAGYGDGDPVASNATAQGRARNRRVDVVILNNTSMTTSSLNSNTSSSEDSNAD